MEGKYLLGGKEGNGVWVGEQRRPVIKEEVGKKQRGSERKR